MESNPENEDLDSLIPSSLQTNVSFTDASTSTYSTSSFFHTVARNVGLRTDETVTSSTFKPLFT